MNTRIGKRFGIAAAITAVALSLPTAVTAHGDPAPVPNPEGPGCDAYKEQVPVGPGSFESMATESVTTAISNNPKLTTFNAAISGQLNPQVNIVAILDNGPYNVFAPVDDAFAKLPPGQLDALSTDAAALTGLLFYHMALGLLGPEDVHGQLTTQEGRQVTVEGKGGDITVDGAKVICGGITASNAKIYMIDAVLDPAAAAPSTSPSTSAEAPEATTETSAEEAPEATTETSDETFTAPTPPEATPEAAEAPSATEPSATETQTEPSATETETP